MDTLVVDLSRHPVQGRRMPAVLAGDHPDLTTPRAVRPADMIRLKLFRRNLALGAAQNIVFDHVRVEREVRLKGWSYIIAGDAPR